MPKTSWTTRVWHEFHADNLTRAFRDVLLTLATYRGRDGALYPSHTTLAQRAGCSVRTVQRALAAAEILGLISWSERRLRAGWRWLRTSNMYRLLQPCTPIKPGQRRAWLHVPATTGQKAAGGENRIQKQAFQAMLREAAALPDLLAMRRATMLGAMRR